MRAQLLAKRTPPGGTPKTLVDHLVDVANAAECLFGAESQRTRFGGAWLRFFRLDESDWPSFHGNLLAASVFHDWGKANDGMQRVLETGQGNQLFWHEHLSALLLGFDGVDNWVRQRADVDWDVVLAAVGSHHLRFGDEDFARTVPGEAVEMLLDHNDFQHQLLPFCADRLKLSGQPSFPERRFWGFTGDAATFDPTKLREDLKDHRLRRAADKMVMAVRAALIAADAVGSGLPRTGKTIESWIFAQFDDSQLCDSETVSSIIANRINDLIKNDRWSKWNEFQDQSEKLPARSLLLAPCGAGKTLAAWRWIAGQVKLRPVKRVLFLYPTRATATEGFKDYVSWAPEADAALLHGTAEYDLDGMFPPEDARSGKLFGGTDPRLFSLNHWSKRIFSATVDQFLAFMSYNYGPICLLPLLADSVIVVDEVHSFDRRMFSALLGFLKTFDVPVLCMTATLPAPRQRQLVEAGLTLSNPKPDDLKLLADAPRYRVKRIAESEVVKNVCDAVKKAKRVLWVVNQVSRAQSAIRELEKHLSASVPIICYHSRFTLDDRIARHREVIAAICPGREGVLAVTTQVCEMSLDIDADLLVTEECPITSLIQRMGRCRRGREELRRKGPGDVLVYKPAKESVYSPDDLRGLDGFLDFVVEKEGASQSDLETGLEKFGPKTAEAPRLNSFLTSGSYAVGRDDSFRDLEEFNVQAVLDKDLTVYLAAKKSDQPGYILPVPRKTKPVRDSRLPSHLLVANHTHYQGATGFWDKPL